MSENDSGIPTGEVIGQHVPTLHRDDRGLRWTCSCGHQSLNKRWSDDEPGVREALHHFTREHVIVTLTDEVAALRDLIDQAALALGVARDEIARLRKKHGYVYRPPYRGPDAGSDTGGVWFIPEEADRGE